LNLCRVLMQEHRIIEKILNMFELEIKMFTEEKHIDPISIYVSIDFIRTYINQVHHGKEENILFRELSKKDLSPEHGNIMNELKVEHKYSGNILSKLIVTNNRYFDGEDTFQEIISYLKELKQFYPQHIKEEDEHFFDSILDYFDEEEQAKIISEFGGYDKKVLQWKYRKVETVLKERIQFAAEADINRHHNVEDDKIIPITDQERRRFKRKQVRLSVSIDKFLLKTGKSMSGTILDISAGGIRFSIPKVPVLEMASNRELTEFCIGFNLPNNFLPIVVKCHLKRVIEIAAEIQIGAAFLDTDFHSQEALQQYLH